MSGLPYYIVTPPFKTNQIGVATATSINKVIITQPATTATLTLANNSTFATSGAFSLTLTTTANTNVTFPTSGTLATRNGNLSQFAATTASNLASVISDKTGTPGYLVFSVSPSIDTPTFNGTTTVAGTFNVNTGGNSAAMNVGSDTNNLGFSWKSLEEHLSATLYTSSGTDLKYPTNIYVKRASGASALNTGFGVGTGYYAESSVGERNVGSLVFIVSDKTDATYSTRAILRHIVNNATIGFEFPQTNGSSGNVLITDGLGVTSWALGTIPVNKTSDQTVNNSVVLVNDSKLKFDIGASQIRNTSISLKINSASSAGFKCAFSVPAGCTGFLHYEISDPGGGVSYGSAAIDVTTGFSISGMGTIDDSHTLRIYAYFINGSTAGTIQFQWAQASAVATDTTVRKSSIMQVI